MSLIKLHNKEKNEMKGAHLRELENLDKSIQVEKQLHAQSISETQVASQAKSEFLSFVCHELRNPLSGIMAIVDMLIGSGKMHGDVADSVTTIKQVRVGPTPLASLTFHSFPSLSPQPSLPLSLSLPWSLPVAVCAACADKRFPSSVLPFHLSFPPSLPLLLSLPSLCHPLPQESELMCAIVNDVLDYAKIEANMLVLDPVVFDVHKMIKELVKEQMIVAKRSCPDVAMRYDIDKNVPVMIEGDKLRLRQVLLNLISNSIKFTFQGSIVVKVELDTNVNKVKFSVSDSGIGIPEKDLEYIFSAFSQSKPSITREFGGTGLGLSISKALVECMEGDIGVQSKVGVGTSFWFSVKAMIGRAVSSSSSKATAPTSIAGLSFLVAEDSATLRKLWSKLLEEQGCAVDTASNGREALDHCAKTKYDVVLMDITMPVLSGDQAVKQLRKDGWTGVVIALTGNDMDVDKEKFIDAGMDAVLTKPFQMERLRILVIEQIKKKGTKT